MKDDGTFLPGLPFVPAADHFPLDQLQLWSTDGVSSPSSQRTFSWRQNIFISCFDQKHLSDTFGTPVLVDLLHTAAICYLATREPHVPCQISPSCGPTDAADEVKVTRYSMFFFFFYLCVQKTAHNCHYLCLRAQISPNPSKSLLFRNFKLVVHMDTEISSDPPSDTIIQDDSVVHTLSATRRKWHPPKLWAFACTDKARPSLETRCSEGWIKCFNI